MDDMAREDIARDVASATVWLTDDQAEVLLARIRARGWVEARELLLAAIPELTGAPQVDDPRWQRALLEELQIRVTPPGDDEQDDLETRELPDITRFAAAPK
ncbi:MAG: hypothetical protein ABMB14_05425 [Myxococcota bacterium]